MKDQGFIIENKPDSSTRPCFCLRQKAQGLARNDRKAFSHMLLDDTSDDVISVISTLHAKLTGRTKLCVGLLMANCMVTCIS